MVSMVLEPSLYAKARLPLEQAESLPRWCYTAQEFYDEEVGRIFRKTWNFVGREDEIPSAGDFLTIDLFGESIIIVRDRAAKVHAFANTCRHRGTRLLSGSGRCPAIRCPYHSWTYALSGDLISTPGMEGVVGFNKADYGLIPVRMESWGGFMFVTLDPDCVPLTQYLGNAIETFSPYRFENMRCTRRKEYDLACNWKLYVENAMEDYHTATVHHVSIGKQICTREPATSNWDAIHMPAEKTSAILPGETTAFSAYCDTERKERRRHLFQRHLSQHLLRDHAGLHVVAACRPQGACALARDAWRLFSARNGRTRRLRARGAQVLPAVGQVATRGQ